MSKSKLKGVGKKLTTSALVLGIVALNTACGQNPVQSVVTNVQIKTYSVDHDEWVQMTTSLNTGGFMLTSVNLPVADPNDHSKIYGQLTLLPSLPKPGSNGGDITISLNISQIANVKGIDPLLPNGTPIPVGGLMNANLIAFPIADTGARLYFALGSQVAMLGAAIPFKELDPAGHYVPGINIFQPIQLGPVSLTAGMFAGAQTNTTGVGFFVDLSQAVKDFPPFSSVKMMARSMPKGSSGITFDSVQPSLITRNKFYQKVYDMSQTGMTLRVQ